MRVSEPSITGGDVQAVADVLLSGWITQGDRVRAFEAAFAEHLDVRPNRVIACSNGTAALHLALAALGIGPYDEVLVPDLTYVATANAVTYTGAKPVPVDIDTRTWTIDLQRAERRISTRTAAILPVHLYGVPCDMGEVQAFAEEHRLVVIEDAAEAIGGMFKGQACGTFGDAAAFSFYANKVITTGEGGAVVCKTDELADRARHLRGQAMSSAIRYFHDAVGFNYRMTEMQGALGLSQIARIGQTLAHRADVVAAYRRALRGHISPLLDRELPGRIVAPWLFTLIPTLASNREDLMQRLAVRGIETRPAFVPLHRLPPYEQDGRDFPIANIVGDAAVSLPTHVGMSPEDAEFVARAFEASL